LIQTELGALILIGTVFSASSHVFPWYLTALLPWIAASVRPVGRERWSLARGLAIALAWYVACTAPLAYMGNATGVAAAPVWIRFFFGENGLMVMLGAAAGVALIHLCVSLTGSRAARTERQPQEMRLGMKA
jgi:hypothetical protein